MTKIRIQISGVGAELVLGNYMPKDATIFNNWEDFFHYNDIFHHSQLLMEHVSKIEIFENENSIFSGKIPSKHISPQKSILPAIIHGALYLRTECAEQAVYQCEFETENFDKMKLRFESQDYDHLFVIGKSFLDKVFYDNQLLKLEWLNAKPLGNICVICKYENGFLIPVYDAIKKISSAK